MTLPAPAEGYRKLRVDSWAVNSFLRYLGADRPQRRTTEAGIPGASSWARENPEATEPTPEAPLFDTGARLRSRAFSAKRLTEFALGPFDGVLRVMRVSAAYRVIVQAAAIYFVAHAPFVPVRIAVDELYRRRRQLWCSCCNLQLNWAEAS